MLLRVIYLMDLKLSTVLIDPSDKVAEISPSKCDDAKVVSRNKLNIFD